MNGFGLAPIRAWLKSEAWRRAAITVVFLGTLFVWIRSLYPAADPPMYLPGEYSLRELMVEPMAKASEARNWALFGAWKINPADEYQFWRPQSPVWVYPLAGFLKVFGVGIVQLRSFAIIYCLIGYLALLALARQHLRGPAFFAAVLFPAVDAIYVMYSRAGMLEPVVNSWLTLSVLCLVLARKHWAWALGAHWAFVLAFFTKAAAAYAVPVLVVASIWIVIRVPGAEHKNRARAIVLAHACALGAASGAYIISDFYWRTVVWNFNHVVLDEKNTKSLMTESMSLGQLWEFITRPEKMRNLRFMVPFIGPLAAVEVGAVLVALVRRRSVDSWRVIIVGWSLCALAAVLMIKSVQLRFSTILVMPFALAAGSALDTISQLIKQPEWRERFCIAAAIGFTAFNAWKFRDLYSVRLYHTRTATKALMKSIGSRRAAIGGYWSAPVVFATPYEHYYVKKFFNGSRSTIEKLKFTDLLIVQDSDIFENRFPGWKRKLEPTFTLPIRDATLRHFALPEPLARRRSPSREKEKEPADDSAVFKEEREDGE